MSGNIVTNNIVKDQMVLGVVYGLISGDLVSDNNN